MCLIVSYYYKKNEDQRNLIMKKKIKRNFDGILNVSNSILSLQKNWGSKKFNYEKLKLISFQMCLIVSYYYK